MCTFLIDTAMRNYSVKYIYLLSECKLIHRKKHWTMVWFMFNKNGDNDLCDTHLNKWNPVFTWQSHYSQSLDMIHFLPLSLYLYSQKYFCDFWYIPLRVIYQWRMDVYRMWNVWKINIETNKISSIWKSTSN